MSHPRGRVPFARGLVHGPPAATPSRGNQRPRRVHRDGHGRAEIGRISYLTLASRRAAASSILDGRLCVARTPRANPRTSAADGVVGTRRVVESDGRVLYVSSGALSALRCIVRQALTERGAAVHDGSLPNSFLNLSYRSLRVSHTHLRTQFRVKKYKCRNPVSFLRGDGSLPVPCAVVSKAVTILFIPSINRFVLAEHGDRGGREGGKLGSRPKWP
jgi:hypothetical protein